MEAKFDVWVTITNQSARINVKSLREKLKKHNAAVSRTGERVAVFARLDTYSATLGEFIKACREYGDISVMARMARTHY